MMKKIVSFLFAMSPLMAMATIILQVTLTNNLPVYGVQIKNMDNEISTLLIQNVDLSQKIASFSAIALIEQRAKSLGLTQKIAHLVIGQEEVALNPR